MWRVAGISWHMFAVSRVCDVRIRLESPGYGDGHGCCLFPGVARVPGTTCPADSARPVTPDPAITAPACLPARLTPPHNPKPAVLPGWMPCLLPHPLRVVLLPYLPFRAFLGPTLRPGINPDRLIYAKSCTEYGAGIVRGAEMDEWRVRTRWEPDMWWYNVGQPS